MQQTHYRLCAPVTATLAILSDLHDRPFADIVHSVEKAHPDLICVPGDFLWGSTPEWGEIKVCTGGTLAFFRACAAIAPSFVSLGNHEWMLTDTDLRTLAETGVTVLDNAFIRHGQFVIGGLTSGRVVYYRKLRPAYHHSYPPLHDDAAPKSPASGYAPRGLHTRDPDLTWLAEMEQQPGWKILLSHHPEYYPTHLASRKLDLVISGHAHGGQIRLFGRGLFAPGQGWFPRYTSGVWDNRLVISRGLSNTTMIPRLFNPREIVYVHLAPEA